jgi:DNA (cytosine-5)-methyltransferase 1
MSFPANWTKLNELHLDTEQLDSARYHALGNAVTPPVAHWLAKRIRLYLEFIDVERVKQETHRKSLVNELVASY